MKSSRFVYFPQLIPALRDTLGDQIPCLLWTDSTGSWVQCSLADLAAENTQEVHVFLPNLHILSMQITVPKKQQKHLARILPFLCEDKLACDLEDIHLAPGLIQSETVAVRALQHSLLEGVLTRLREQGLEPRGIYSDAEPLLHLDKTLLWLEPTRHLLVDGQRSISLDPSQVAYLSELLPGQENIAQLTPEITVYRHARLDNSVVNLQLETLRSRGYQVHEILLQTLPDCSAGNALLRAITANGIVLTPAHYVNLLSGPYTPARQTSGFGNWRPLAWAASLMIGLNLLYLLASGVYFEQRADRLRQGSEQLYRQYFPQDRRVVNIRAQTQAHLDRGQQGANQGFFNLLGQLQPGWEQHKDNLQLVSLRYHSQRQELLLDLESTTIGQLDQFQQSLGVPAELLSANEDHNNEGHTNKSSGARGRIKLQGGR